MIFFHISKMENVKKFHLGFLENSIQIMNSSSNEAEIELTRIKNYIQIIYHQIRHLLFWRKCLFHLQIIQLNGKPYQEFMISYICAFLRRRQASSINLLPERKNESISILELKKSNLFFILSFPLSLHFWTVGRFSTCSCSTWSDWEEVEIVNFWSFSEVCTRFGPLFGIHWMPESFIQAQKFRRNVLTIQFNCLIWLCKWLEQFCWSKFR